jgi:hypothetical protein
MITLTNELIDTYDLEGEPEGILEARRLCFYDVNDYPIPTMNGKYVDAPLLMIEEIDEENSGVFESTDGKRVWLMKPVEAIHLSREQADFIKKYFGDDDDGR